ncbi:hypothetical protein TARUN_3737 [Trichoderma arundinaceum]|uniref:Uncharacterized protein n=1 Tax=Trichoderma arundinaceum TaxID=490622 RepID=A0A395NQW8_TRIAR|nr:hypothetical protein TARUN_3737 [Trichoderma arundinaceum]
MTSTSAFPQHLLDWLHINYSDAQVPPPTRIPPSPVTKRDTGGLDLAAQLQCRDWSLTQQLSRSQVQPIREEEMKLPTPIQLQLRLHLCGKLLDVCLSRAIRPSLPFAASS